MGGYIRMDKDLLHDSRVADLAEALVEHLDTLDPGRKRRLMCDAVIGGLYRLWRHADTYIVTRDLLKLPSHLFEEVTGLPVTVLESIPEAWLRRVADDMVELPGYTRKNRLWDREHRRAMGRQRTQRWRERKRANGDASPASHVTRHRDGGDRALTGTGTGYRLPVPGPPGPGPVTGAESASPTPRVKRAAAPRQKAEVPWQPPADGSTWESNSPPGGPPRGKSFDDDFKRRFGMTPAEAELIRQGKQKTDDDGPKF